MEKKLQPTGGGQWSGDEACHPERLFEDRIMFEMTLEQW